MEGWLSTTEEAEHALKAKAEFEDKDSSVTDSVFGDIDINDVSDDPFGVAESTYFCVCTDSKIEEKEETGARMLIIVWTIDQPGSEYDRNKLTERYQLPIKGVRAEDQEPEVKKSLKWLKLRLRKGFDLSETDMARFNQDCGMLVGKEAYVTTKNNSGENAEGEKRVYANVKSVMSPREYKEKNAEKMEDAAEVGASIGL